MFAPKSFNEGFLEEQDGHRVYFSQYGNLDGPAIVSLHGGPGSQSKSKHAKLFDLETYRVITFDQRGCGKSEPLGKLEDNTTQKLVGDIERLRKHIGVDQWFVTGSSWGSTLALVYAQSHPDVVRGLLLSAIFLGDQSSMDWSFQSDLGTGALFTDTWEEYVRALSTMNLSPQDISGMYDRITKGPEEEKKHVAQALVNWDKNIMTLGEDVSYLAIEDIDEETIASMATFLHYEVNQLFMDNDQIIKNMDAIRNIPVVIVHGRYDVLCPFKYAHKLAQEFTSADLVALPGTAHRFVGEGDIARKYIFESFLKDFK